MPQLKDLDVQWVSLVDRAAVRDLQKTDEPRRFLIWKAENQDPEGGRQMTDAEMRAEVEKAEKERDELRKQLTDQTELKSKLAKAEQDRDELTKRVETLEKAAKPDKPEPKPVDKSELTPEVRALVEKAEADAAVEKSEREKLAKRVEDAEKLAKAERDERLTRDFVAKAETFKALPVEAEKFGPVLKAASESLSKEEFEALETVLKAADEQIAKSELFKEQGSSRESTPTGALADATKKAEEIRKSDPKLSADKALEMVFKADRSLEERYLAEVRG